MEPFNVHILGCGSALPTLRHHPSCQVVELRGKMIMLDCGEGAQLQLRRSKIKFTRIQSVFITHLHGDHCFGLIGMISTFGMVGRVAPLHVYAPEAFGPVLNQLIETFCQGLEFKVEFHAVDTKARKVVYEDRSMTVTSIPLSHRVPCCGYLIEEKPTLPHIRRDMIDFYHIPISQINNIKNGADWVSPEGEVIENKKLVSEADKPRSYAYLTDTRYIPDLWKQVEGVDLMCHESTYASDYEDRAKLYYHSTARQAATIAMKAKAHRLLLTHFSARYDDESVILNEARSVFPNSILANEGMMVQI